MDAGEAAVLVRCGQNTSDGTPLGGVGRPRRRGGVRRVRLRGSSEAGKKKTVPAVRLHRRHRRDTYQLNQEHVTQLSLTLHRKERPQVSRPRGRGRILPRSEALAQRIRLLLVARRAQCPKIVQTTAAPALRDGYDVIDLPVVALEARVEAPIFFAARGKPGRRHEHLEALRRR